MLFIFDNILFQYVINNKNYIINSNVLQIRIIFGLIALNMRSSSKNLLQLDSLSYAEENVCESVILLKINFRFFFFLFK
jgi:hypothetical protein